MELNDKMKEAIKAYLKKEEDSMINEFNERHSKPPTAVIAVQDYLNEV
jgi:hypothetical protein